MKDYQGNQVRLPRRTKVLVAVALGCFAVPLVVMLVAALL